MRQLIFIQIIVPSSTISARVDQEDDERGTNPGLEMGLTRIVRRKLADVAQITDLDAVIACLNLRRRQWLSSVGCRKGCWLRTGPQASGTEESRGALYWYRRIFGTLERLDANGNTLSD